MPAAVDGAQLEIFVTAAKAIVALRRQYEPRMAAAGSQAEADAADTGGTGPDGNGDDGRRYQRR